MSFILNIIYKLLKFRKKRKIIYSKIAKSKLTIEYNRNNKICDKMGFYRKYNTIIRTVDNFVKLYKLSKKSKSKKKDDKK